MQKQHLTNASFFDSIFNHVGHNPTAEKITEASQKITGSFMGLMISDLAFGSTNYRVEVSIDVYDPVGDFEDTESIIIPHEDFQPWLQDKGYLTIETGSHSCEGGNYNGGPDTSECGYTEFLEDYLTGEIVKEYLTEKNICSYGWDAHAV